MPAIYLKKIVFSILQYPGPPELLFNMCVEVAELGNKASSQTIHHRNIWSAEEESPSKGLRNFSFSIAHAHLHNGQCCSEQRTPALCQSLLQVTSRKLISSSRYVDDECFCVRFRVPQPSRHSVFTLHYTGFWPEKN